MMTLVRTVLLVLVVGALQTVLADAWSPLGAIDGLMIVAGAGFRLSTE